MTRNSTERGSAFFIILIAIAIFAALSFAVMQGSRVSQSQLSGDQARLAAQDIIQYANAVEKAVQALRLRGCSQQEISFEGAEDGQWNGNSPSDESCHVFSLQGGKVHYKDVDTTYYIPGNPWSGLWMFIPDEDFIGVGTNGCADDSCADLALELMDLKQDVCMAIEKILGDGTIPEDDDIAGTGSYVGTFDSTPNIVGDDDPELAGRGAACVHETNDGTYAFYQILIAR